MGGSTKFKPTHGMRNTKEYRTWQDMLNRCRNPSVQSYIRYGARGIITCERWNNFINFYEDMGDKPDGYSLDRIDSNGNYEPSNCRWIPLAEQQKNTSRNRRLTYLGETKIIADWSRELGIKPSTISKRLKYGWSEEKALSE